MLDLNWMKEVIIDIQRFSKDNNCAELLPHLMRLQHAIEEQEKKLSKSERTDVYTWLKKWKIY